MTDQGSIRTVDSDGRNSDGSNTLIKDRAEVNVHQDDQDTFSTDPNLTRPGISRMQTIRMGMKRALTATSFLSVWTAVDEKEREQPTIEHPLAGLTRRELRVKVRELADKYNLADDLDTLQKGALIAQKGKDWETVTDELQPDEIEALEIIESKPWKQVTLPLLLTVAAASCGAITLGWDQGVLSGANLHYPTDLKINPDVAGPNQILHNWLTGIISAGPFLGAAVIAVWLSDPLNHYLGRKGSLVVAAIFLLAGPLGSAFCKTWVELLICRIILGVGIGFLEVTAPVFAAESAPQEIRGAMTICFQLFTAFGILLGSSVSLIFEKVRNDWRLMLSSPLVPVPFLLLLVWRSPESARWYLKWGKVNEAYQSLRRLRNHRLIAARDLYLIYVQIVEEQNAIGGSRNVKRFAELFYKNRVRQSTVASCIAHFAQVLSGINIVCFFSSTIFTELTSASGHTSSNTRALLGSWGFGIVNFVFTFPALWSIDKLGRRSLMLLTTPNLCWTLLATALVFLRSDDSGGVKLGLVLFFVYLYTAFYSVGMGPVAFCYSAESAAQTHRELSVALAAFVNNGTNAILSIVFFRMRQVFTTSGLFGFYAGMNLVMFVLVLVLVPETKQLSLEQLDAVFAHSNQEFASYIFNERIPYYWKKYIMRQKDVVLRELNDIHPIERLEG